VTFPADPALPQWPFNCRDGAAVANNLPFDVYVGSSSTKQRRNTTQLQTMTRTSMSSGGANCARMDLPINMVCFINVGALSATGAKALEFTVRTHG